jgi:O-acetyl-ADP-ribose deacetylase (regulator of RNase III)
LSSGEWGSGVVMAISRRWVDPERLYRKWSREGMFDGKKYELGNIQVVHVESNIDVVNMIGQKGIRGRTQENLPPVRYGAIRRCLKQVAEIAKKEGASVVAPKFGSGLAGGKWEIIEQIIQETLCVNDINVTIYEL